MVTAGTSSTTDNNSANIMPQFPGEDCLAHAGTQFKEAAETRLSGRSLLGVANGLAPPAVEKIIDVDLAMLPSLPPTDRDYNRREESRMKAMHTNRANAVNASKSSCKLGPTCTPN